MSKITFSEYMKMARDPDVPDEEVLSYSKVERGDGPFDPQLKPDPEKVEMTLEDQETESGMSIGNGLARIRRHIKFRRRIDNGETLPVLVSEGDSWFQFPLLIREVIDQLDDDYLIWSVGAAGDTAQNMVFANTGRKRREYMKALRKQKDRVRGFLFSAAGNDIIGDDPDTGDPVLFDLLKPFNGDTNDIAGHVDLALLGEKLNFLKSAYTKVVNDIRSEPGLSHLPIFIHGYDYAFPYPWGENDPRDPIHADKDEWLGKPLNRRNITDPDQRRNILKFLIDALYDMLTGISADSTQTGVWLVNCRGAMPSVGDWADEIHGTSEGFMKVADRFKPVISQGLAAAPPVA